MNIRNPDIAGSRHVMPTCQPVNKTAQASARLTSPHSLRVYEMLKNKPLSTSPHFAPRAQLSACTFNGLTRPAANEVRPSACTFEHYLSQSNGAETN
ncbi:hypothetical protein RRG08_016497 [Elysia crispata]|uniref:Uncharacterized protein n=1 Tax=Elysia crispata TaxID=231223 RepID=A0AAE0YAJ5_9GAST|nr:hypothetical protein RRG08_016497 [Elysia crispata]